MLEILKCGQCGGELDEVSSGVYRCACCGNLYTKKEQDVEAAFLASLGDERYARLSAARQNLWNAMHAEFVSSEACLNYARELKSYVPSDYYANFAETVNGRSDRDVSDFLNGSSREDMDKYADAVLDFMLRCLTPRTLNAVCGYIDRAFELTSKEHTKYVNLYETEAQRVCEGIYELTTPRSVFLAYSGEDYMYVTDLCDFLEEQGMTCFVSARNLRHGRGAADNYEKALKTAMDNCSVFVFVSSKNSRNLSCDALRLEMTYIRERDRRYAPPEYRNLPYDRIPATYKTRRVEYLVDEYGKKPTSADGAVKEFFSGLEWRKTREEVSDSVLGYLLGMTEDDSVGKDAAVPDSVSTELSASMEKKEKNILDYVKKLMSIGDFDGAEKRLSELIYDEYSELGRCSAAVYYHEILVSYKVVSDDELIDRIVSANLDFSADKNYILAKSCEDGEYKTRILEIERRASEIAADREASRAADEKNVIGAMAETDTAVKEEKTVTPEVLGVSPKKEDPAREHRHSDNPAPVDRFVPNPDQLEAVTTTEGPVLITAGPGTGKTATLVQRILHLIRDLDVKPREMFVSTFTDKAAKELITRISDVLTEPTLNIGDMYVGTFHSLCRRILDENLAETNLCHNYDLLDEFGQKYFVFRHIGDFTKIQGYDIVVNTKGYGQYEKTTVWGQAEEI
ncbi:MAG: UvrD-helicase domain-containing protein [Bacteroidales bacterium]|nr:UvrD-helicase domain-containing protein [Bacteroidales bacterium]